MCAWDGAKTSEGEWWNRKSTTSRLGNVGPARVEKGEREESDRLKYVYGGARMRLVK